jgi:CheY-like chemotaxis protein
LEYYSADGLGLGKLMMLWKGMLPVRGDVVIVEDDPVLRPLMSEILEGSGAVIHSFESADDALVYMLASHQECSLVIADHNVPGQLQGAELMAMIKSKWPLTPLILTSGYMAGSIKVPDGVVYVQKPWDLDDLIKIVADLLQPGVSVSRR